MLIAVRDPMGFRPARARARSSSPRARPGSSSSESLRLRSHRRRVRARRRARARWSSSTRTGRARCGRSATQPPQPLRLRVRLLRAPRLDARRTLGLPRARALGRRLANEHPVDADVVIPVPDSGVAAAIGYARESGIPYDQGLIRSHYVGRTFIEPQQSDPSLRRQAQAHRPCARCSPASASSSSTTRSCAARPRARSSR